MGERICLGGVEVRNKQIYIDTPGSTLDTAMTDTMKMLIEERSQVPEEQ
jgi:hypothetical protein